MYDLPYHKENNEQVVKAFIAQYPFACVSGSDAENKAIAPHRFHLEVYERIFETHYQVSGCSGPGKCPKPTVLLH